MRGLNISVGRQCFVTCRGCYNHFGVQPEPLASPILLTFLRYAREAGADQVTFCGGDPLSRRDIVPLLLATRQLGYRVKLDTVGTPLLGATRTMFYGRRAVPAISANVLAELVDLVGIALDGGTRASAVTFRKGREALLDEQLCILQKLDDVGARICVNTVLHMKNKDELPRMLRLLSPIAGLRLWQIFQFSPTGPLGYRNRAEFEISTSVFDEAIASVSDEAARIGFTATVEAKRHTDRVSQYVLIDSDGLAWMPEAPGIASSRASPDRVILGDIKRESDHGKIVAKIFGSADEAIQGKLVIR